ncbi:MAG TPA: hypothetical protein VIU42_00875 [Xanthobacteraceae bacterium]|jgi:hypothetical protein
MLKSLLAAFLLGAITTAAGAVDVKDLAPCKPAAARFCDQSNIGATITNLLKCGATLASVSNSVGEGCRQVLRRYGQL